MNRRNFLASAGLASTVILMGGVTSAATAPQQGPASIQAYSSVNRVEVIAFGIRKKPQIVVFRDNAPQHILNGRYPIAVSLAEHDDITLKMSIYRAKPDGSLRLVDYSYPGKNSTQTLLGYDLTLELKTF